MRISDWSSDVCSSDLLLLGLTAILRFHYLPAIAVLALFTSGKDVKERWLPLAAGGLTALAGAGLIDLMMGATPFAWMVENFRMNITENRAADFGVSGPLAYFGQMLSYRSEEHTSELQSLMRISYAVFCLKKKKK